MICVPPARFEFGLKVRYHVPAVFALPRPVVVCIEPGEEALYPQATHIVVDPREDVHRKDLYSKDAAYVQQWTNELLRRYPGATIAMPDRSRDWPERRFIPEPIERYGIQCDVVVCPRRRKHAREKNWHAWPKLAEQLKDAGFRVFAAGAGATSDRRVGCPAAWEHPRELDASIEAMLSAKLVIATDAGLAHLAVLCGRPLLLIGYGGGLVAPGPVTDHTGRVLHSRYWKIRLERYYESANHTGAPIRLEGNGWEHPDRVFRAALEMLE